MQQLQARAKPIQTELPLGVSEENKYKCSICKDKRIVIYRVHKDTEWKEDFIKVNGNVESRLVPDEMVLEDDFLAGKVCGPDEAWQWRDTYSKKCNCVQSVKTNRILKSSEITEAFKSKGFKTFITEGKPQVIKDAFDCAVEYYQSFRDIRFTERNSMALLGNPGSGKTHLLTALCNNLMSKRQIPVLYFPYVEGFTDLKDDFNKLQAKLDRMKKIEVLFIDDLFKPFMVQTKQGKVKKPRATEWQVEMTYEVINYRYNNMLPFLISSELNTSELREIDPALADRIIERCSDFTVNITGIEKDLNHRLRGIENV
ncbi:nSTAND3 domain-containing NTPase [Niallia sp. FSL R7-0648]|uniref:nSTAND3 domain-containing NTPase n=1 Tax=Niallia sp. FSL R7-0648 TaxID=2954521 RepID=UPI004046FB7F